MNTKKSEPWKLTGFFSRGVFFLFGMVIVFVLFLWFSFGTDSDDTNRGDPLVNRFLFHPTVYRPEIWEEPDFAYENVWITTSDGVKINAWYLPAENPQGVVLFSHGNAGNLSDWGYAAEDIRKRFNVSVLIYDYRGYGKSEGKPSVPGILVDARAARDWLCKKTGLKPEELIYQGRSLGGAVAIDLAAETGAKGLVVESSFTSIPAMAKERVPFLPVGGLIKHKLDSLSAIKNYTGPYLQSHGDADSVIPYQQGVALFDACPSRNKEFVLLEKHDHNDRLPDNYYKALGEFYRKGDIDH